MGDNPFFGAREQAIRFAQGQARAAAAYGVGRLQARLADRIEDRLMDVVEDQAQSLLLTNPNHQVEQVTPERPKFNRQQARLTPPKRVRGRSARFGNAAPFYNWKAKRPSRRYKKRRF